jgi:GxxExxY protein
LSTILFREESYEIIGACMETHKVLGCGFLEAVYQEALEKEFSLRCIPYDREFPLRVKYKEFLLEKEYTADFICYDKIILELKALSGILPEHEAQVINYLKVSGYKLGLLVNFGLPKLQYKQFVL